MLYNLARRREIDPVNIDIVDVADKFLEELERAKKLDLRISGRVLLYAAILIRMKSDIVAGEALGIIGEHEEEDDSVSQLYDDFEDLSYSPEFEEYLSQDFLEDEVTVEDDLINALISAGRKRVRRYTTLEDLIRELESAERVRKRRRKRKRQRDTLFDPMEVPHDEDLEITIEKVKEKIGLVMKNKDVIRLSDIAGFDLVSKYVSVLHLAFRRIFELYQEKIFESEIEIRRIRDERED